MARFYHDDHLKNVAGGIFNKERDNRLGDVRTLYSRRVKGWVVQGRLGYHWHTLTEKKGYVREDAAAIERALMALIQAD